MSAAIGGFIIGGVMVGGSLGTVVVAVLVAGKDGEK